ncbi:hypothetical protein LAZ67_2002744 [Cordylochernes scorpioides]|uniref:Uncharacterized protein n=1 Tax=Cordylochernes scorpioides TaxID=51811 RepID=A0ABY6K6W8_9ARAC|nr:hypothetical protein LAZ67_2002744 [Cordylochernes scorpioides]
MMMFGHMLQHPLKRSNGKSYPTRRIAQTVILPIINSSDQCNMAWLTSTSPTTMKRSKGQCDKEIGPRKIKDVANIPGRRRPVLDVNDLMHNSSRWSWSGRDFVSRSNIPSSGL